MVGADSLEYLSAQALPRLLNEHGKHFCSACFDGNYPTKIPKKTGKDRFEQKLSDRDLSR